MYPAGVTGVSVRRVTLPGGLAIRVLESGPVGARIVALVHGWGASVYSFSEMIPALTSAGYRVLALDLPGHGLSDKPRHPPSYAVRALADVVLSTLATVQVDRFALVAHSMGGAVALDIATRVGVSQVERLALISPVGLGLVPLASVLRVVTPVFTASLIPRLLTRRAMKLVLMVAFGTRSRPVERDVDAYWAPTQFDEFAEACRECIHQQSWERAPESLLRGLKIPVLVIAGGRDRIVLGAARRASTIPGAHVVLIPEGGHVVLQECADITNRELLAFLDGGAVA